MPALEAVRRGQMRERRVQRLERRAYQEGVERGDEGGNSAEGGAKWRECVAPVPGGSCAELREGRLGVEVEVDSPGGGSCTMSWACQSGEGGL